MYGPCEQSDNAIVWDDYHLLPASSAICHLPHGPIIFIKIVRYVPRHENDALRQGTGGGAQAKMAGHNLIMNKFLVRML